MYYRLSFDEAADNEILKDALLNNFDMTERGFRKKFRYDRPEMSETFIVYAHACRLCSNWFRYGSTTISCPQCSLTFLLEPYLHRCREQSFAIRAYALSAVGIDVVSVHKVFAYRVVSTVNIDIVSSHAKYCRIAYGITR